MVKILLVLMISICAFGADVCEMKDIEVSNYAKKNSNNYINKNSKLSNEKLLQKAFDDCIVNYNKEACLYIYNKFVVNNNFDDLKNPSDLVVSLLMAIQIALNNKNNENKEIYKLISMDSSKEALDLINYYLNLNSINDKKIIQELETFKKMAQFNLSLTEIYCPLFFNGKLAHNDIDMPCACKKSIAFLDNYKEMFVKVKLLCDKYEDAVSCFIAGALYENGKGVRIDFKQAKEYYGLSCDYGHQTGCDGYKRLMHY